MGSESDEDVPLYLLKKKAENAAAVIPAASKKPPASTRISELLPANPRPAWTRQNKPSTTTAPRRKAGDDDTSSSNSSGDDVVDDDSLGGFIVEDSDDELSEESGAASEDIVTTPAKAGSKRRRDENGALSKRQRTKKRVRSSTSVASSSVRVEDDVSADDMFEDYSDENTESSGDPEFSHAAFDALQSEKRMKQRKDIGLGIAKHLGHASNPEVKLSFADSFHAWCSFLVAGICLEDGGREVLQGRTGSPDAILYNNVVQSVERKLCSTRDSLATSQAWKEPVKQGIKVLPFIDAYPDDDVRDIDCQACGRRDHPSAYSLRMFGPAVDISGLYAADVHKSVHGMHHYWTDSIANTQSQHYNIRVAVGRFCKQRLECFASLHHFKHWMLLACSAVVEEYLKTIDHRKETRRAATHRNKAEIDAILDHLCTLYPGNPASVLSRLARMPLGASKAEKLVNFAFSEPRHVFLSLSEEAEPVRAHLRAAYGEWLETDGADKDVAQLPFLDARLSSKPLYFRVDWANCMLPFISSERFREFTSRHAKKLAILLEYAASSYAEGDTEHSLHNIRPVTEWALGLSSRSVLTFSDPENIEDSESESSGVEFLQQPPSAPVDRTPRSHKAVTVAETPAVRDSESSEDESIHKLRARARKHVQSASAKSVSDSSEDNILDRRGKNSLVHRGSKNAVASNSMATMTTQSTLVDSLQSLRGGATLTRSAVKRSPPV